MFILYGTNQKVVKDVWVGRTVCSKCGNVADFHLHRVVEFLTIFFVPVISCTNKRLLVCDSCQCYRELNKKEYAEIKAKQTALYEQDALPPEVVKADCNPSALKLWVNIVKLVVSAVPGAFGAFMTLYVLFAGMSGEIEIGLGLITLPIYILLMLPFYLSLKHFMEKLKLKKAYDRCVAKLNSAQ